MPENGRRDLIRRLKVKVSVMFTVLDRTQLMLLFAFYPTWNEGVATVTPISVLSCDRRRPLLNAERATYFALKVCLRVSW